MSGLIRARWRKSSYNGGANNCVELAVLDGRVGIRDSKCPDRPPLLIARAGARVFISGVVRAAGREGAGGPPPGSAPGPDPPCGCAGRCRAD
ncbi:MULTISPECIES: DUF397 domain-containing protein [unclassified Streptomyces]|uniref:DUF397 domain-containing protein n=1 Tax=unclassified Streptomyces TaxID=2593676 RepID=UPI00386A698A